MYTESFTNVYRHLTEITSPIPSVFGSLFLLAAGSFGCRNTQPYGVEVEVIMDKLFLKWDFFVMRVLLLRGGFYLEDGASTLTVITQATKAWPCLYWVRSWMAHQNSYITSKKHVIYVLLQVHCTEKCKWSIKLLQIEPQRFFLFSI